MSDHDIQQASEAMEVAYRISKLLNTGLDRSTLGILINLLEEGVNPEALAAVVKELRRESSPMKHGMQDDKQFHH